MKVILGILVIAFIAVISTVPLSNFAANQAFKHPDRPWAPGVAATSGRLLVYATSYTNAREVLEKARTTFPQYPRQDRLCFLIGLCYEKDNKYVEAKQWYGAFLAQWPNHEWAPDIKERQARMSIVP